MSATATVDYQWVAMFVEEREMLSDVAMGKEMLRSFEWCGPFEPTGFDLGILE